MIIGLVGHQGAGKSTTAEILVQSGYHYLPFAGPLKSMLGVFGLSQEQLYGSEKEIPLEWCYGRTPRQLMQWLGTEWGRDLVGPDIWTNCWLQAIKGYRDVVTDDVRFINEAELITQLGGTLWRVERPGVGRKSDHPSERLVDELAVSRIVKNDGTKLDLSIEVIKLLKGYIAESTG